MIGKTLTIRDTGVGMSKADLVANLGTVAKSGTTSFVEQLAAGQEMGMIGQFGVGFYSVYLVADKVRVASKHPEDEQYVWESTADSSFTVAKDPRGDTLSRGTEITLYLKEDAHDFLDQKKLEELVRKYSEFITFPISLYKKSEETVEIEEVEEEGDEDEEGDLEVQSEDEDDVEPTVKTEVVVSWNWERLNNNVAIWSRESKDVSDEEYQSFYRAIAKDTNSDALSWIHFKAEGEVEFKSILFVPSDAGNLYNDYSDTKAGIRLYVRKVLIQDDFDDLLPRYLNFIRGVVDSDDLPLNVSRETLQQHKVLRVMGKKLVRKALEMLRKLANKAKKEEEETDAEEGEKEKTDESEETEDEYDQFWEAFGKNIKLGLIEDSSNRTKLSKLLRFKTSFDDGKKWWSLEDYVSRMKEFQKDIFYIAGEGLEAVQNSPFLERLKAKGIEVVFMTDPIDEYAVQNLTEFDGKKLKSATKEGMKFGDEDEQEKKREQIYTDNFKGLTEWYKKMLGENVEKVIISNRLETTPSMLVTSQYGYSANMERIMKSQAFADPSRGQYMASKKTMEINPRHPIVSELAKRVAESEDDEETKNLGWLLYDSALMQSGFTPEDPKAFASRMYTLMKTGLSLDSLDLLDEVEVPAEEPAKDDAGDEEAEEEDGAEDAAEDAPKKGRALKYQVF